jgi:hypothetical protein
MIVRATTSFVTPGRRHVAEGELFDSKHPIVQARRDLFAPLEVNGVERATARPGEKRSTRAPRSAKPKTEQPAPEAVEPSSAPAEPVVAPVTAPDAPAGS